MNNFNQRLISRANTYNENIGNLINPALGFNTICFFMLIPNFIMGIFALQFVKELSTDQCMGPDFMPVNEYLYKYGLFTCITVAVGIFSSLTMLLLLCDFYVLPIIIFFASIITCVCYFIFLLVWFYEGIILMIYTAQCYTSILPQWTLIFIILMTQILVSGRVNFTTSSGKERSQVTA